MQSTPISQTETETISALLATTKFRQPRLICEWQKVDGKLVCQWIVVGCKDN